MLIDTINKNLKTAMIARENDLVDVLKGLKTAIQYASVAKGVDNELSEEEMVSVLQKERKKRLDAIELYDKAGETQRSSKESFELAIVENYLPKMLSEDELRALVGSVIKEFGQIEQKNMGQIIGLVKSRSGGKADGAMIARLVKEHL